MPTFYVEVVRPCFGGRRKLDFNVFKAAAFSRDVLSPDMSCVFEVQMVNSSTEAVSCVMELAAGFSPLVRLIMGGRTLAYDKGLGKGEEHAVSSTGTN